MIRINLLSEGRRPVVAKKPVWSGFDIGGVDLASALLGAVALLGLLVALGHNFVLGRKIKAKKDEVAVAQVEVARLAPIIKEVEEFKAKKAELQNKVRVISNLKANQRGPVQIMDEISRALPELLWLERMDVKKNTITLTGQAFNTNAVANFIENLDQVAEFQEPILRDTSQRGQVYGFVVTFNFIHTPPPKADQSAATGVTES
jgi:type IV pilus assembly protein PilN